MAYVKHNFEDGQILNAQAMNEIEDGIVNNDNSVTEMNKKVFSDSESGEVIETIALEDISGVTVLDGYTSSLNSSKNQVRITESGTYTTYCFMAGEDTKVFFENTTANYLSIITIENSSELSPTETTTKVYNGTNAVRYRKSEGNLPTSEENSLVITSDMSITISITKGAKTTLSFIRSGSVESNKLNNDIELNSNQLAQCKKYISKPNFLRYVEGSGLDSSTEKVEVYIPCAVGFVRYDYLHTVNADKNADNWRIGYAYACNDDFSERYALTTTAEWECALHLLGTSDFSGGFGHGDEIGKTCVFNVDGSVTDIRTFTNYTAFKKLSVYTLSDMFNPADSITQICTHASEHIFDSNGVTINQTINWTKDVTITQCYLAMLGTSQQVVDTLVCDMTYEPVSYSSLGSSYTKYYLGAEKARQYSSELGVTSIFNVTKYPELPSGSRLMATNNGKTTYHKLYYVIANNTEGIAIARNTVWKSTAVYSFEIEK